MPPARCGCPGRRCWSAAGRPLARPDLAGHGWSPPLHGYSFEALAQRVVDGLGPVRLGPDDRLVLLGHSLGGVVALALAARQRGLPVDAVVGLGIKAVWSPAELAKSASWPPGRSPGSPPVTRRPAATCGYQGSPGCSPGPSGGGGGAAADRRPLAARHGPGRVRGRGAGCRCCWPPPMCRCCWPGRAGPDGDRRAAQGTGRAGGDAARAGPQRARRRPGGGARPARPVPLSGRAGPRRAGARSAGRARPGTAQSGSSSRRAAEKNASA
ncbi:alpha/beta fold hydrolase [Micromonospora sp. BRA006-A]|nr:alpha/beta fold hydrolase [Micromonospora sp. BRA006-A]